MKLIPYRILKSKLATKNSAVICLYQPKWFSLNNKCRSQTEGLPFDNVSEDTMISFSRNIKTPNEPVKEKTRSGEETIDVKSTESPSKDQKEKNTKTKKKEEDDSSDDSGDDYDHKGSLLIPLINLLKQK